MKWCDYILVLKFCSGFADNRKGRKAQLRMLMGTIKFLKLPIYLIENLLPPPPQNLEVL